MAHWRVLMGRTGAEGAMAARFLTAVGLLIALTSLAGCDDPQQAESETASMASRELDSLARETGALPDSDQINPAGAYSRRYEGGGDSLCVVAEGVSGRRFRFGAETRIGREEYCLGRGEARLAGSKLLLEFEATSGQQCTIVADYEGDRIVLPGSVDLSCAGLCSDRGSFAGVRFPRVSREEAGALSLKDRAGRSLCR